LEKVKKVEMGNKYGALEEKTDGGILVGFFVWFLLLFSEKNIFSDTTS